MSHQPASRLPLTLLCLSLSLSLFLAAACDEDPDRPPGDAGDAGLPGDAATGDGLRADGDAGNLPDAPLTPDLTPAYGAEYFVSPKGKDTDPGSRSQPFATLERARKAVRDLKQGAGLPAKGVVVWLRSGRYPRTTTFLLEASDSGEAGKPVVYRGYPGEKARIIGGAALDPTWFKPITASSPIWAGLEPAVRAKVLQVDLPAHGVSDYGTLQTRGFGIKRSTSALELFVDGAPMTLARWPDADADDPPQTHKDSTLTIYGDPKPDVTGTYVKSGTADGVNAYTRQGLVGGKQYNLHRHTWTYQGAQHTAWFLTTTATGYPSGSDPFWNLYKDELGPLKASNGGTGQATLIKPGAVNHGFVAIAKALSDTQFTYHGTRPERWKSGAIWFHGYWEHAWADRHVPLGKLDTAAKTITLTEKPGYGIATGQTFYAENLPEEITTAGEWYIDRSTGVLYLYPPKALSSAEILVSTLKERLIHLKGAQYVELSDLVLEVGRAALVQIEGGAHNKLVRCTLRNGGVRGAIISGQDNGLERCEVHGTGDGAVALTGGTRASLTKAGNYVNNSVLHHFARWSWTYHPGVAVSGCGHVVQHNLIRNAPHSGILYSGNEHLFELNEIHHVCEFTSDAGAIYTGRDWGYRGNMIRYNFIHDINTYFYGYGVHGVYLDDCVSGNAVFGNVLYRVENHGILLGGGRDNLMENNVIARCGRGLSADSRGLKAINNTAGDSWNLLERLGKEGIKYQQDPWAKAYPALAKIPNSWAAISASGALWRYPQGCIFSRNIGFANKSWTAESNYGGSGTLDKFAELKDNIANKDPLFTDESKLDLSLKSSSPALKIPGFKPIPFDTIGPQP